MNKFDKEDKTLLAIIIILAIASIGLLIGGFSIFSGKWDGYYLVLSVSVIVFFILSILSLAIKKYKETHRD